MSEFRGRGRGMRGSRGGGLRGGPPRGGGGLRGRGGFDRDSGRGFSRGRGGGGFPRSRGGPIRSLDRDSPPPPRKVPMMSRGYESERGRGPPLSRRVDRYEDNYDRGPPSRARDSYPSPTRDSARLLDRLTPPRTSFRDRDLGLGNGRDYPSARGDYLAPRSYSPPPRDSGFSSRDTFREERRDSFNRPGPREYGAPRLNSDYGVERSRDFREPPRDYGSTRDYPPPRSSDFRDTLSGRGELRERPAPRDFESPRDHHPRSLDRPDSRDYGSSSRFSSRLDDRPPRGPPREFSGGRGGPRGGLRGRDERGGRFISGGRGRGPPRGRGRPDFGGRGRRSPPSSRDAPPRKVARMEGSDSYSSRR